MIEGTILVCDALALEEGGKGVRFPVTAGGEDATRHKGDQYDSGSSMNVGSWRTHSC